ncbi:MAG: F0F1 ATP synthase subunit A [Bacteroidetes bacterium]|nr:F0F1 ATP synthase subunit A [Bacteroidota bacterium]
MYIGMITRFFQEPQTGEAAEKVDIGGTILHHITNSHELELPIVGVVKLPHFDPIHIGGLTVDLSPTKHVVMMWFVAVLLVLVFGLIARPRLVPRGLYNFLESIVVFIREEVVRPNFGELTDRYINYFLTIFWFILFMNLLGLIPYGATATGNIAVTATLAVITFLVTQYTAIRSQGLGGFLKHLTGGVHWMLWPIMVPVELVGLFTKPFALAVRLFANMTAGHVVILSLLGLIFVLKTYFVAPVSIAFALFIYVLELFVGFLQAYIFTMLSALFIGMGLHHAHEEHGTAH